MLGVITHIYMQTNWRQPRSNVFSMTILVLYSFKLNHLTVLAEKTLYFSLITGGS